MVRFGAGVLQRIYCTHIVTRALSQRRMEMKIHAEAACRGAKRTRGRHINRVMCRQVAPLTYTTIHQYKASLSRCVQHTIIVAWLRLIRNVSSINIVRNVYLTCEGGGQNYCTRCEATPIGWAEWRSSTTAVGLSLAHRIKPSGSGTCKRGHY